MDKKKPSSSSSPSSVVVEMIPNKHEEQPDAIEGNSKVFEEEVTVKLDALDAIGKFVTMFEVSLCF